MPFIVLRILFISRKILAIPIFETVRPYNNPFLEGKIRRCKYNGVYDTVCYARRKRSNVAPAKPFVFYTLRHTITKIRLRVSTLGTSPDVLRSIVVHTSIRTCKSNHLRVLSVTTVISLHTGTRGITVSDEVSTYSQ